MNFSYFPKNKSVYTTEFVINDDSDIVYVSLDEDGDFQVFSKEGADTEKTMLVSLENILSKDPSLLEILNIEKGEQFYRKNKNSQWVKMI